MTIDDLQDGLRIAEHLAANADEIRQFGQLTDEEREAVDKARTVVTAAGTIADRFGVPWAAEAETMLTSLLRAGEDIARLVASWRQIEARVQSGAIEVGAGVPVEVYRK